METGQKASRLLVVIGLIALLGAVGFTFTGYWLHWSWTGFTNKTLWDWLGLLASLAVPVVVGLGAAWFTTQQGKVSDRENKDNQREVALQAYIDKISELMLKEHLGELTADSKLKSEHRQVRRIVRARTITVLTQLDARRKHEQVQRIARIRTITVLTQLDPRRVGYVFAFLRETGLMSTDSESIVSLKRANLNNVDFSQAVINGADLREADLRGANLSGAVLFAANLSGAILKGANLINADLRSANLSGVSLHEADLSRANLSEANLSGAHFRRANLINTDLTFANLSGASLLGANLSGANLFAANLSGANLNDKPIVTGGDGAHPGDKHIKIGATNLSGTKLGHAEGLTAEKLEQYKTLGAFVH